MGNEGLLGLSPAHRRGLNPPFPTLLRRTTSGPDIGWRSLVQRHKFLLYALGLLTFLCTIYLYFAITLGTRDLCSGLGGEQRALCQIGIKAREANHLRRLMFMEEDSGMYGFFFLRFLLTDCCEISVGHSWIEYLIANLSFNIASTLSSHWFNHIRLQHLIMPTKHRVAVLFFSFYILLLQDQKG